MNRTLLGTMVLASSLAASAYWAGNEVAVAEASAATQDVAVNTGVSLLRLAVPAGDEVGNVVRRDAEISAGFEVIDRRSLPAALVKAGKFNRDEWNKVGAQAVIMNAKVGNQIKFQLYDLAKGSRPVLSKGFPAGKASLGCSGRGSPSSVRAAIPR